MLDLLTQPLAQRLTMTLLHFLWQGFVIMFALQVVKSVFRVRQANTRYALSLAALAAMAICPMLTYALLALAPSQPIAAGAIPRDAGRSVDNDSVRLTERAALPLHNYPETDRSGPAEVGHLSASSSARAWRGKRFGSSALIDRCQPYVLVAWLIGVLGLGIRLITGYTGTLWVRSGRRAISGDLTRRVEQLAERMGIGGAVRIFASDRVRQATTVGFWRPVVLLPFSWLAELPPQALDAIIAHELAHIRRWDLWISLYQRILETTLFYHPAVWWLSRRVSIEREMCCDEMALAASGGRVAYAKALNLAARLACRSLQPAPAAFFLGEKKMDLLDRVRSILNASAGGDRGRWWPVGIAAVVLPLAIWSVLATLPSDRGTTASADEQESERQQRGEREREAGEGERERGESPEARYRREGDRERGESPEARERREGDHARGESPEARYRREGDRDREGSPGDRFRESDRERGPLGEFRPQTEREAALYRMVLQLQREVAELRRQVGQMRDVPRRDSDRAPGRPDPRAGDREAGPRDPHPARAETDRERAQQISIFNRYDRSGDKKITFEEFLAMREGTDRPEVRAQWERVFVQGDRNRDRTWSLEEFLAAAQQRRREAGEGRGDAPREGDPPVRRDAPREGDRPRTDAPRDGDRPRTDAPREGDRPRTDAPRDGDRPRTDAPRDGDRPRTDAPRDGDRPRTDAPREGDRPPLRDAPRDGDAPVRDRPRDGDRDG